MGKMFNIISLTLLIFMNTKS